MVLGCGNSVLSEDLHSAGFTNVTSIDYSEAVINEMRQKCGSQPALVWETMDATVMRFDDESWETIVDKGTLDALYAEDTPSISATAEAMLRETQRVLASRGRFFLVTMAQDFVLAKVFQVFASRLPDGSPGWAGWVTVQPFRPTDGPPHSAYLLVFEASPAAATAPATVTVEGALRSVAALPGLPAGERVTAEGALARVQALQAAEHAAAAVSCPVLTISTSVKFRGAAGRTASARKAGDKARRCTVRGGGRDGCARALERRRGRGRRRRQRQQQRWRGGA
jgi:hypothetical protein